MKRIQSIRKAVQIAFLILAVLGIYMDLRFVIIAFLPASLLFGNFFCGWICPFGTAQDVFGKLGNLIFKRKWKMPRGVQKYLKFSRYLIMGISVTGLGALVFDQLNAYRTFFGILDLTGIAVTASLMVMFSLLLISMFFERPFCNYLCTEGVKYGLASFTRIFSIQRNEESCVNCKKCDQACPMNIPVSVADHVRSAQCINCLECVSACPKKDALQYTKVGWKGNKKDKHNADERKSA